MRRAIAAHTQASASSRGARSRATKCRKSTSCSRRMVSREGRGSLLARRWLQQHQLPTPLTLLLALQQQPLLRRRRPLPLLRRRPLQSVRAMRRRRRRQRAGRPRLLLPLARNRCGWAMLRIRARHHQAPRAKTGGRMWTSPGACGGSAAPQPMHTPTPTTTPPTFHAPPFHARAIHKHAHKCHRVVSRPHEPPQGPALL
jgi:hypothetical protein